MKRKVSVIIPVYCNEDTLEMLYDDLKNNILCLEQYEWEVVMVNDGSKDNSYNIMSALAVRDKRIKIYNLSRNFGSHASILCGLCKSTGECAVIKAADLQEPSTLILDMIESWEKGNNVVLALREGREEKKTKIFFANLYYWLVRKTALSEMPKNGFDAFLLDRKVIYVLEQLDEKNSALTGQILWSGFKTGEVYYTRLSRKAGESKWTLKKKIKLVKDTLFSFSSLPITVVLWIGLLTSVSAFLWAAVIFVNKLFGNIVVNGWTTLIVFNLLSFGIIMFTLGILGEYLWRTFESSRNRPPYIIEETNIENNTDNMSKKTF